MHKKDAAEPITERGNSAPTYARIRKEVLAPRCLRCHSGSSARNGVDLSSYVRAMASNRIVPGNPEKSILIQMVESDEMPPSEPIPEREKDELYQWVKAGAKP